MVEKEQTLNPESDYEQKRQQMILELARMLHDRWRKRRRTTTGFEPRIKITTDQDWIKAHNDQTEVDIANTSFDELPVDWQRENIVSAEVALSKIEDALYLLHDRWLDRNFESATPEQKIQYSRLPNGEKEEDIQILYAAIDLISRHNSQE